MNKDEHTASLNLEISGSIARLTSKMDDEICEVWKINKSDIVKALNFKENLIKYIEDELNLIENVYLLEETDEDVRRHLLTKEDIFKDLFERIKK